ncbi:MAG: DUF3140 domain-containing protein [Xenococcaceae cyanobacterium]
MTNQTKRDRKYSNKEITDEQKQTLEEFQEVVNLTCEELQKWLTTQESNLVGQKKDENESIGHKSGKHILEILNKEESEYTKEDFEHMQKVISYVRRHSAQKPSHDIEHSRWRYSLMNWGHDPLKD